MSKTCRASRLSCLVLAMLVSGPELAAQTGSWILPSSVYRNGANGAEFQSDVRLLNQGRTTVTVTASLYDQVTGQTFPASPFAIAARSQASFDNILRSLFGRTLEQGSFGPIRLQATAPIVVSSSVNNVNACGTGAIAGQWLPGIDATQAMKAGTIGQLALSASSTTGYRTNLVFMNPGAQAATVNAKVRKGDGTLLSSGAIGPLDANGFSQVALDSDVFPGAAGTTDTNLWLEFTSDQPVLAFTSVINNASGDPFAVVATADPNPTVPSSRLYLSGLFGGQLTGTPTPNSVGTFVCLSSLEWTTSLPGDIRGDAYTFNLGLITSNQSSGSGTMRADILHRRASTDTVLATATFTTSPQYSLNHLTVTGVDPSAQAGDGLLFRLTRVSGVPCVYWSPGPGDVHYIEVPPPAP